MTQTSYSYYHTIKGHYIFVSAGKKHIQKVVQFESTVNENIINIGFGDLLEDGSIDDTIKSNNGDMIRVLATVIEILKDYTGRHPDKEILFTGSTRQRTRLYTRILKTYYREFKKDFHISAIILSNKTTKRVVFDPIRSAEYVAFLIRRND